MKKKKFKIPLKNELAASVPLTNLFLLFYILGLNITSESNLSFVLSFFFTFFLSFFFVSFFGCFFLFYCGTQYMKPVLPPHYGHFSFKKRIKVVFQNLTKKIFIFYFLNLHLLRSRKCKHFL